MGRYTLSHSDRTSSDLAGSGRAERVTRDSESDAVWDMSCRRFTSDGGEAEEEWWWDCWREALGMKREWGRLGRRGAKREEQSVT
ncbi:hypothetical protein V6N13_017708 [Hibiscus sabdariffa]